MAGHRSATQHADRIRAAPNGAGRGEVRGTADGYVLVPGGPMDVPPPQDGAWPVGAPPDCPDLALECLQPAGEHRLLHPRYPVPTGHRPAEPEVPGRRRSGRADGLRGTRGQDPHRPGHPVRRPGVRRPSPKGPAGQAGQRPLRQGDHLPEHAHRLCHRHLRGAGLRDHPRRPAGIATERGPRPTGRGRGGVRRRRGDPGGGQGQLGGRGPGHRLHRPGHHARVDGRRRASVAHRADRRRHRHLRHQCPRAR